MVTGGPQGTLQGGRHQHILALTQESRTVRGNMAALARHLYPLRHTTPCCCICVTPLLLCRLVWDVASARSGFSTDAGTPKQLPSLYIADVSDRNAAHGAINRTSLLLGFVNYFERHLPSVGFFSPVSVGHYRNSPLGVAANVEL